MALHRGSAIEEREGPCMLVTIENLYLSLLMAICIGYLDSHPEPLRRSHCHVHKGGQNTEYGDKGRTYPQRPSAGQHVRRRVEIRPAALHIFSCCRLGDHRVSKTYHH